MIGEQKPPKFICTVRLINGERVDHVYNFPLDYSEKDKFIESMVDKITGAMTRGKATFLWLENPGICYNPDNVLGVEFTAVGAEQFEEAIRKVQDKKAGFI